MFSCEYWEIFKNTYFDEHLRTAALVLVNDKDSINPLDTGRKLNVLFTFNLRPVHRGNRLFFELLTSDLDHFQRFSPSQTSIRYKQDPNL